MMTRLALGMLFAWSGAWTCESYTLADGGKSPFNPRPAIDGGGGQKSGTQTTDTQVDGGTSGTGLFVVVDADGGGVTLGPVANFTHNFAWIANMNGTVSLINTDAQQEIGNYPAAVPIDMAGNNFCMSGEKNYLGVTQPTLAAYGPNIAPAMSCLLENPSGQTSSRTVVDLNGGVWVANRAWAGWSYNSGGAPDQTPNGWSAPSCQYGGDYWNQPSVTHINDAIDHLEDPEYPLASCNVRCPGRNGGQPVTSTLEGDNLIAPTSAWYTSAAEESLWCPDPTGSISAQGSKKPIACAAGQCVDPTDPCNPVNYDDCAMYTVPIGANDGYDQYGIDTRGSYLARGEVIAPNCDPLTRECDIWVGLSAGGLAVRLSGKAPDGWANPFSVHEPTAALSMATDVNGKQVFLATTNGSQNTLSGNGGWNGASPYGAVIDCRGYLWGDNPGAGPTPDGANGHMLYAIDTNAINSSGQATMPPITQFELTAADGNASFACNSSTGVNSTVCNGLPMSFSCSGGATKCPTSLKNGTTNCGSYGVAVDVQGRIWVPRYNNGETGGGACGFDPGKWLTAIGGASKLGTLSYANYADAINAFDYPTVWHQYTSGKLGAAVTNLDTVSSVGIVSDKYGNVYGTYFGSGSGMFGFTPDTGTVDAFGNETGFKILFNSPPSGSDYQTHGVDVAIDSATPSGMALWGTDDSGDAVEFDPQSGAILKDVRVNRWGFYTYSDFTGYALRYVTSPLGEYTQVFTGQNSAPEFTKWTTVSFSATIPPMPQSPPVTGDDIIIAVRAGNSIPELAAAQDTEVCDVGAGCTGVTCAGASCSGTVSIASLNLQGRYLAVDFTLQTPGCGATGSPVLYTAGAGSTNPGN